MADVTLALTGNASTVSLGFIMAPGIVTLAFPVPTFEIASAGAPPTVGLTLPLPDPAIAGYSGFLATVELELPALAIEAGTGDSIALGLPTPTLSVTGVDGAVGSVALALPTLGFVAHAPDSTALTLALPTVAIAGQTGISGSVTLTLPALALALGGAVPFTAGVAAALPLPVLEVVGLVGATGSVGNTLRGLALAIAGRTGTVGTVALMLPMVDLTIEGYQPIIGLVMLTLPSLQLRITGRLAAQGAASTVTMHTETQSLTTYSNFPFNSFARFNGVTLGASDNGVFALTGDTDDGAAIDAVARLGLTDYGTSFLKRIDRVYVGCRAGGDLVLRVFTDETTQRDYRLRATAHTGLHGSHVTLGKGLQARYWQFEVRNQNGADFDIDMMELKPVILKRRIGGRDA